MRIQRALEDIPLKQGLKHEKTKTGGRGNEKALEDIPLKQGLKQSHKHPIPSRKSGIRGHSIKTRIETSSRLNIAKSLRIALEDIPLKQGLKPHREHRRTEIRQAH